MLAGLARDFFVGWVGKVGGDRGGAKKPLCSDWERDLEKGETVYKPKSTL